MKYARYGEGVPHSSAEICRKVKFTAANSVAVRIPTARACKRFEDIQSQLERITEKEEAKRDSFETDYFDLRSKIQEIINAAKPQNSTVLNASFGIAGSNRAKLAPIVLPISSGDIKGWESFCDIF